MNFLRAQLLNLTKKCVFMIPENICRGPLNYVTKIQSSFDRVFMLNCSFSEISGEKVVSKISTGHWNDIGYLVTMMDCNSSMNHWYDCGKFGVSIDFSLDMNICKLADGEKELIMESILLGYRDRIGTTETNFYVDDEGRKIHVARGKHTKYV